MIDHYEVLGVSPGSSEEEIRRAYLNLVRRHPPDREPQRFGEIRRAYEQLRDPVKRLHSQLFPDPRDDSLDAIMAAVQRRLRETRIPLATLLALAEK